MKTLFAAAALSIAAINAVTLAEVVKSGQNLKNSILSTSAPAAHAVTAIEPTSHSLEKAITPGQQTSKWTWIPSQRTNDGAPQTQIVAIPVPAPGAAALIGLSGLIISRRRNGA